jgi:hypothetical protein
VRRLRVFGYPALCKGASLWSGTWKGSMTALSSDGEGRAGGCRRFRKQRTMRRHRRMRTRMPSIPPAMAPIEAWEVWDEVVTPVDDDDDGDDGEPVDFEAEELELGV